eukprot:TRINITY_DN11144_c0_g1_i1.p1 TRINITY_DN11144_c0_g1~~TRINITY_DN11144_c0_g1_i1.p1  ORF type:complete len:234 (-),score=53.12 TRINITY_DN11144_c0_g1_i1:49-750(-)
MRLFFSFALTVPVVSLASASDEQPGVWMRRAHPPSAYALSQSSGGYGSPPYAQAAYPVYNSPGQAQAAYPVYNSPGQAQAAYPVYNSPGQVQAQTPEDDVRQVAEASRANPVLQRAEAEAEQMGYVREEIEQSTGVNLDQTVSEHETEEQKAEDARVDMMQLTMLIGIAATVGFCLISNQNSQAALRKLEEEKEKAAARTARRGRPSIPAKPEKPLAPAAAPTAVPDAVAQKT